MALLLARRILGVLACVCLAFPLLSGAPAHAAPTAPSPAAPVTSDEAALRETDKDLGLPADASGLKVSTATLSAPAGAAVAGVTWPAVAGDVDVFIRTVDARGAASAWENMDPQASSVQRDAPVDGTDPLVVTDVARVEAAAVSATSLAATLRLTSSEATGTDAAAATSQNSIDALPGTPSSLGVRSRAEWGANESIVRRPYNYATVTGVMIHHTAGSNSYTAAQVPSILRSIQAYHVNGRGWADIGYNVLVDKYGTAWEGRGGGLHRAVQAGHGLGITNARVFGLSFMGNYETAAAPAGMLDKAERIIAWKFQLHGVDPAGTTYGSGGQDGGSTFLNAISGHRDENATTCPGRNVYNRFAEIRSKVKAYMATDWDGDRTFNQDATGDGRPDVAVVDGPRVSVAQLLNQPSTPALALTLTAAPRDAVLAGDLSGDGRRDIVVRTYDGSVRLHAGLSSGGYAQTGTTIATGWGGYDQFIAAPNFGGDRRGALLALDRAGRRILVYPANGRGGLDSPSQQIATGVDYDLIGLAGLWDGDPAPDLVARRPGGTLDLLSGNGYGDVKKTTPLGGSWADAVAIVGGANFDGAGRSDLITVTGSGAIRFTPNSNGSPGGATARTGRVIVTSEFGGSYRPLTPARILDTRAVVGAAGPIPAHGSVSLQVTGRGGVPATGVAAVVLNVTVTRPTTAGNIQVYPSQTPAPTSSNLNFAARQDVPNAVVVKVGRDGRIVLRNNSGGTVHLIGDVSGYHIAGKAAVAGAFSPVSPARVLDTRRSLGAAGPVAASAVASLQVTGRGGVPATGVSAVVLNVTVTRPAAKGNIKVFPSRTAPPSSSNLNFSAGQDISNLVVAKVGSDGRVNLQNQSLGTTHLVADVAGYYVSGTPTAGGAYAAVNPARVLDTRTSLGAAGPVAPYGVVPVKVAGTGGVPATGVSAVILNVTVTRPSSAGNIRAYPSGTPAPASSSLNFVPGQDVPNLVVVKVGAGGRIDLRNSSPGSTHLIADVAGYYR